MKSRKLHKQMSLIPMPKYKDCCRHTRPRDKFLGTIEVGVDGVEFYDVYIYQDNALDRPPDMHVCLRYGNEDSQYISPGNAKELVSRVENGNGKFPNVYLKALPLIKKWLEGS